MKGVQIKIFYGYEYDDEQYGIQKTGYDHEIIDCSPEPSTLYDRLKRLL